MSYLSPQIPSSLEIQRSIQRSQMLLEKSAQLSKKIEMEDREFENCYKCHLCSGDNCRRYSQVNSEDQTRSRRNPYLYSFIPCSYGESEAAENNEVMQKNLKLKYKNQELKTKVKGLEREIDYLNILKSYKSTPKIINVDKIGEIEEKIEGLSSLLQSSQKNFLQSTADSEKFKKLQSKIQKTDKKYSDINKKIDHVEKLIKSKRPSKDLHCQRCIKK